MSTTNKENTQSDYKIWNEVSRNFDNMGLKGELLKGVYCHGFNKPSNIQQRAIIPLYQGHDLIAQSQSGTGKTGAFSIGLLNRINDKNLNLQGLILSPTRELVQQTYYVLNSISSNMNLKISEFIGGTEVNDDIRNLKNGCQIAVGTPGRLFDLIERGALKTNNIITLIIDEADQMLATDFKEQIRQIIKNIPQSTQVSVFSATLTPDVLQLCQHLMNDPYHILLKNSELTLEGIRQYYVDVNQEKYKFDVLLDLYQSMNITSAIIYVNTLKKCDYVYDRLIDNKHAVSKLHGKMEQSSRNKIMKDFRLGHTRILLTTDLLARGIDVQQVSLVINYDLPNDNANYIHRIGRTGRYGKKGVAINFSTKEDFNIIENLEKHYSTSIVELPADLNSIYNY